MIEKRGGPLTFIPAGTKSGAQLDRRINTSNQSQIDVAGSNGDYLNVIMKNDADSSRDKQLLEVPMTHQSQLPLEPFELEQQAMEQDSSNIISKVEATLGSKVDGLGNKLMQIDNDQRGNEWIKDHVLVF